jgi:hypothetical protein
MLESFLSTLRASASNDPDLTRRRAPRRDEDRCVAVICGQTFPVENWSFGGLLLQGEDRLFGDGQDIEVTLKFKLRNTILDVTHRARVVRKGNQKIALAFGAIGKTVARTMQQVVDDAVAREFARSQELPA